MITNEKLELVADEVIALSEYMSGRNLKTDMVLSVLVSTTMAIVNQLDLPEDLLLKVLISAQELGKEMLADDQTMH